VWESGVKCWLSSHGSSHVGNRNSTAVVCCYLIQTILIRSACPVFLASSLAEPRLPLAGSVPVSQEALDRAVLISRCISTASVSLLQGSLAEPCSLPSCRGLERAMLTSRFLLSLFSYWSPTTYRRICTDYLSDPQFNHLENTLMSVSPALVAFPISWIPATSIETSNECIM
jgi:hypothetical protein